MVKDKAEKRTIRKTELERLQNEVVGGRKASGKAKAAVSGAKERMMKGARNACGPFNKRDWRWAGS
jgi:hypothetical protein